MLLGAYVEDGRALVTVILHDRYNKPSIVIQRNELIMSRQHWDIEFVGPIITVRNAKGSILHALS